VRAQEREFPIPVGLDTRRDDILRRRRALERRLEDGYHRIEQALASGEDVEAWEDFWFRLLLEYETVCDELPAA